MASPTPPDAAAAVRRRRWYLLAVFGAVAAVVVASYAVYSSLPPRTPRTDNVVFSRPDVSEGNASFVVQNVSGGPYAQSGFRIHLTVNGFPADLALATSSTPMRMTIGPNVYVIRWDDADADGTVSAGDPWAVTGDGVPLPTLSLYEFGLEYQGEWTAKVFWSTT